MIDIKDNFLHDLYFQSIKQEVLGEFFPWYLQKGVNEKNDGHVQMTHIVYKNNISQSNFYEKLIPLFNELNAIHLVRVKFNLIHRHEKIIEHGMHIDIEDMRPGMKTAIMYINTNNGYTIFENGDKVDSLENRVVIFKGELKHSGTTNNCEQAYRCVLNLNYF